MLQIENDPLLPLFERARALQAAGRWAEAEAAYHAYLSQRPRDAEALHAMGTLMAAQGRIGSAMDWLGRAMEANPRAALYPNNLGVVLQLQGRHEEAVARFREALALNNDFTDAYYNLGTSLNALGRHEEAAEALEQAVKRSPGNSQAHNNLGIAFKCLGNTERAARCFRQAAEVDPGNVQALNNLGTILDEVGKLDEAIGCFRQALKIRDDDASLHFSLGGSLLSNGEHGEAIACFRKALALKPEWAEVRSNLLHALHFDPQMDSEGLRHELDLWYQAHGAPLKSFIAPPTNDRDPERRLKVGYVSPDFRDHVIGRNLVPLLREHDRSAVELFCYSNVKTPDAMTGRFQGYADHWRDISAMTDRDVWAQIRRDHIDILVDLTLHLAMNRLCVFAQKPAPVQVTFAGYPGSTGLPTIDYRLTDPWLDPPKTPAERYAERSIRLPSSFWCYDPLTSEPGVNALPARAKGHVTFGCLNNFSKINPEVLSLWAKVLREVPESRLILLVPKGSARRRVLETFRGQGIDPGRIEFANLMPRTEYLRLHHRIDIVLDTFPYNGHTTSLDALWMGVPVVTLVGGTVVGRAGVSQLMNLGLPELIAHTREEYVRIACGLAEDLGRLKSLRAALRGRMEKSCLMDAPAFARGIEGAYRRMWRAWCNGETASS